MKKTVCAILLGAAVLVPAGLDGQSRPNCFLENFEPKTADLPPAVTAVKPAEPASVVVTFGNDTIGPISKYVFGNAIAAWAGAHTNREFVEGVELLAPTLIRFPGGSWSNGYFWNGVPADVPDSIYDGTTYNSVTKTAKKNKFWGQTGKGGWQTTTDQYYALRENTLVEEGLITVNYGYARYGTSDDPVAKAAHLAADWVRVDDGRTRFWEVGNENGGPWEYGWMIDTTLNKDGQPQIITGALYGQHFRVFADSMRAAAADIGVTIYIGGQVVIDGPTSWNFVDRKWNEEFFREVGDAADFYVIHNYISTSNNVNDILTLASTELKRDMDFLKRDFSSFNAPSKPVALTEYNINDNGNAARAVSFVNGMQAVVLVCELMKNNYGLGARWLLLSGESTMFYGGSDADFSHHPRADFYTLAYLQTMTGDHAVPAASTDKDVLCYGSRFASGETSLVTVNKGTSEKIVGVDVSAVGAGSRYYVFSFTGGTDTGDFSPNVSINGFGPSENHWGPYDDLYGIPAAAYPVAGEIKFLSPPRSIQMVLIEAGDPRSVGETETDGGPAGYQLYPNYPNPFNPSTTIRVRVPERGRVTLKVYNVAGEEVATLVDEVREKGTVTAAFDAGSLPAGLYVCRLQAGRLSISRKITLIK
ncbi:MAG: T9SS type A sorting domain-containing protein [bacterium]|nr:T9SS type A sorting domain-containing protein [bacterium]